MLLWVSLPRTRVTLAIDTDLVPRVNLRVVRELVVSPLVTEVLPAAKLLSPNAMVVLLQQMEDLPQEMAYLVLRTEILPLVKEVLLDENVVPHSCFESFLDCLAALGLSLPTPAALSI